MADAATLARIRWRCRRGMVELDVLLLRFLDQRWSDSPDSERSLFLRLLDCEDDNLWRWFMGITGPDDKDLDGLVARIRALPPRA
ncbi:MAG: succinate dehydrogenase assembly factor 2 [Proteobacteria bacterium]|nr:succinate dehydrogenase assembly factor 2 [Pseudomonadota bacterium]